jgi:hypothetical protein
VEKKVGSRGGGGMKRKESVEKIPFMKNFVLVRREEGPKMNNSGRFRNNLGTILKQTGKLSSQAGRK